MRSAALLLALAACSSKAESPSASPSSSPSPPEGTAAEPAAAPAAPRPPASQPDLAGAWVSPKCGDRTYERRITFEKDGAFTAEDRVSPCPPGARCIWSGIVNRAGRYELRGDSVALEPAKGDASAAGKPLPASLGFDREKGAPFETAPEERCLYERAP